VLGDLYERCGSKSSYIVDALRTLPMVIASRVRRVTDPQVLLMEAFVLCLSFLGAQQLQDPSRLDDEFGFLRLAIPAAIALLALRFIDAYAKPGTRKPSQGVWEASLAIALAFLPGAVPLWTMFCGGSLSILLLTVVRALFPPLASRPVGANAPAQLLRLTVEPLPASRGAIAVFAVIAILVFFAILRTS
jgi:hypothetical protein